ncbi:ABC transporter substrate-binding protein [Hydrogenophaga pseudoflava]|jgi:alpha-glucoside transport system substrate-binding protein|uniref:Bacterial extracellular solute-binding protein n=1 Tax=Hydrogenophaga pseudoflava TaxID=47421 RepID=A0A4P6WRS9_HYDPS|nr:ABC transporter substrate-binding protein [Hydrogenophaga pseudoflava]QBM26492.1 Bacterial extracellular solute-binding protein [Hydrogenophaga pseudoflava]
MFKTTTIAGAAALALGTLGATAHAADYKGPDLKGETITVTCPWTGAEEGFFKKVVANFEKATGATVKHSCSQSSEQQIVIDIKAGSPSNISVFPQPGLAANMAAIGGLVPLGDKARDWVKTNYAAGSSWADLGTYKGKDGKSNFYGLFFNVNVKSLVWYIPENFKEKGYKVPKSMEELQDLTKKIAADGGKPWCIGLGSDAATGWPATDWVEDMMLRTQSPQVYDDWTSNKMKFNDKRVVEAIEAYGWFARNDAYVDGGAKAVATVSFKDSPKGMFGSPPKCYMHRQASFIPAFFPEGKAADADFFYFPAYKSKNLGNPVLGGGTIMTITKDSKGARAFMEYLQHPQAHEIWMAEDGFLTPHKGTDLAKYKTKAQRKQGEILLNATTFRFDGSDLMPGAVGAGSFWKGMVDYSGGKSAQAVADDIQKSWDALK